MKTDEKYIVETFIEADVTSADALMTCHASMGGAIGIDSKGGEVNPLDAAKRAVREHEKLHWLEQFLQETARWDLESIQGATAKCRVRSKVHIRSANGNQPLGEFEFEEQMLA